VSSDLESLDFMEDDPCEIPLVGNSVNNNDILNSSNYENKRNRNVCTAHETDSQKMMDLIKRVDNYDKLIGYIIPHISGKKKQETFKRKHELVKSGQDFSDVADQDAGKPKKSNQSDRDAEFEAFYDKLKQSIKLPEPNIDNSINIDNLPDNKEKLLDKLSSCSNVINKCLQYETGLYGKLGHILAVLKNQYITKCENCSALPDEELYEIFRCKSCKHNKMYFVDVQKHLKLKKTYNKSTINYWINLGELYMKFLNFKYCTISSHGDMKNYIGSIREKMESDTDVWSCDNTP